MCQTTLLKRGGLDLQFAVVDVASDGVLAQVSKLWGRWRESRREYQVERALYKAGGNPTGPFGIAEHVSDIRLETGEFAPRVEAPKHKGPDPSVK